MTADQVWANAQPDDRELLARHVGGDQEAFAELFRRHRDRLWAVALGTIANPDDAADALQDAMIKAFRGAVSFRGDAAVTTWLHRIVVNACLDLARRRAVRPATSLDPETARGLPASPSDPIESRELQLDVKAALAKLPFEQRAALVLVDMQGFSVDEAAQILECAPGTVKSRCARGRARLLPLLADLRGPQAAPRNRSGSTTVPSEAGPATQPKGGQPA